MRYCLGALALSFLIAGCTGYATKPLRVSVNWPRSASAIAVDPARLPFRGLSNHVFNRADGLDMDEVAMLAVATIRGLVVQPPLVLIVMPVLYRVLWNRETSS